MIEWRIEQLVSRRKPDIWVEWAIPTLYLTYLSNSGLGRSPSREWDARGVYEVLLTSYTSSSTYGKADLCTAKPHAVQLAGPVDSQHHLILPVLVHPAVLNVERRRALHPSHIVRIPDGESCEGGRGTIPKARK